MTALQKAAKLVRDADSILQDQGFRIWSKDLQQCAREIEKIQHANDGDNNNEYGKL
jgi:hypothetical protein